MENPLRGKRYLGAMLDVAGFFPPEQPAQPTPPREPGTPNRKERRARDYAPDRKGTNRGPCTHPKVAPSFDVEAARAGNLSSSEVQRRWPRFHGTCPDCGLSLILYASFDHYTWGDW